jgi:hypothetical protein
MSKALASTAPLPSISGGLFTAEQLKQQQRKARRAAAMKKKRSQSERKTAKTTTEIYEGTRELKPFDPTSRGARRIVGWETPVRQSSPLALGGDQFLVDRRNQQR